MGKPLMTTEQMTDIMNTSEDSRNIIVYVVSFQVNLGAEFFTKKFFKKKKAEALFEKIEEYGGNVRLYRVSVDIHQWCQTGVNLADWKNINYSYRNGAVTEKNPYIKRPAEGIKEYWEG